MNFSPFVNYTNRHGLSGVKVRQWHPAIFVPNFVRWLRYWSGTWGRYREYERALREIHKVGSSDFFSKKGGFVTLVMDNIQSIDCDYECSWTDPYGFVPEDGCPIHDV